MAAPDSNTWVASGVYHSPKFSGGTAANVHWDAQDGNGAYLTAPRSTVQEVTRRSDGERGRLTTDLVSSGDLAVSLVAGGSVVRRI